MLLPVVGLRMNAQFPGEELIHGNHLVGGAGGAQTGRAKLAKEILQAGELSVLAGRDGYPRLGGGCQDYGGVRQQDTLVRGGETVQIGRASCRGRGEISGVAGS